MRLPVSWLREYVDFDQSVEELAHLLTIAGLEVKSVESTGDDWDRVFVGVVEQVTKHPDADSLVLAKVSYGHGKITVVTGAPNIAQGQKVALALEGAVLEDPYSEKPRKKKLKPTKIRGIRSEGMACSERELGLSMEHEGILVLSDDAPVGAALAEYLGDYILDLDLTPNFAYASSVVGIAREVSAITGGKLHLPEITPLPTDNPGTRVEVADDDLLSRYLLLRLENITIKPSPGYIQQRLRDSGLRTINNVVDITNYVMLEYGQPLHPFDAANIRGDVSVRASRPGEKFETLDHQVREMPANTIMIADSEGAIAIGGIMGGLHSEVSEGTTAILLESATFSAPRIRRSSRALGLRTDASSRFEKGMDSELASVALARAVELLQKETGATPSGDPYDWYPSVPRISPVRIDTDDLRRLLGIEIPASDAQRILNSLGFETALEGQIIEATPPSYRADIQRPADLVEEIGRIWGYDNIQAELPRGELPVQRLDRDALIERKAREWLARAGMQEVINYDLTSPRTLAPFEGFKPADDGPGLWAPTENMLRIVNPLSTEHEYLRPSLLPKLLRNVRENLKHEDRVWLFELDRVFISHGQAKLPDEPKRLGMVMAGYRRTPSALLQSGPTSVFDLKGVVEGLLTALNIEDYSLSPVSGLGDVAVNSLGLQVGGQCAGWVFQLAPGTLSQAEIEEPVFVAEVLWEPILSAASLTREFKPFSRFPAVRQDLAVVVPESTPAGAVQAIIDRSGDRYLSSTVLVEVYRGKPLEEGTKSLLYSLAFQANDRTLTEKEASKYRQRMERALQNQLNARIRGTES